MTEAKMGFLNSSSKVKEAEQERERLEEEIKDLRSKLAQEKEKSAANWKKYEGVFYASQAQKNAGISIEEHQKMIAKKDGEYSELYEASGKILQKYNEQENIAEDLQQRLNNSRQECNRLKKTRAKLKQQLNTKD